MLNQTIFWQSVDVNGFYGRKRLNIACKRKHKVVKDCASDFADMECQLFKVQLCAFTFFSISKCFMQKGKTNVT